MVAVSGWTGLDDASPDDRALRRHQVGHWWREVRQGRMVDGIGPPTGRVTPRPMFSLIRQDEDPGIGTDAASWPHPFAEADLDQLDRAAGRTSHLTPTVDWRDREQGTG